MEQQDGVLQWSMEHNSTFSIEKFGLLNCSRYSTDLGPLLTIGDQTIQPEKAHLFLGVKVDRGLRWQEQINWAVNKGTKWLGLFRCMAKRGVAEQIFRWLYLTIAVPSMLYAADVFLTPTRSIEGRKTKYGSIGAIYKLTKVQQQAAILITGGM